MKPSKRPTAIKSLLCLMAMAWSALSCAAPVGTVTNLAGALLVKKADGGKKILARNSTVEAGDTLITVKGGYAQVRFIDDSQLVFQPNTTLTVTRFDYDVARQENDHADFALAEGGVRFSPGAMGKRSKDSVTVTTPSGKLAMHDASAVVQYVVGHIDRKISAARAFIMASLAALDESLQLTRTDAPAVSAVEPMMLAQATPSGPVPRVPVTPIAPVPTFAAPPTLTPPALAPVVQTPITAQNAPAGVTATPGPAIPAVLAIAAVPAAPVVVGGSSVQAAPAATVIAPAPVAAAPAIAATAPPAPVVAPVAVTTRPPGLYVQVLDGLINLTNPAGTNSFAAGQFGYTASITTPPVVVPANPGMQFTPPPVFNAPAPLAGVAAAKPGAVDCVVR